MKDLIARITAVPWVAHVLRANQRFTVRLGNQFGAAITYFSVLVIVPTLMVAVSTLGLVIRLVPGLRSEVDTQLQALLTAVPTELRGSIEELITKYLDSGLTIGLTGSIGLLSALYAGAGWIGNLKSAVRTQWRVDFDLAEDKRNIVLETLVNLAILVGLLVLIGTTGLLSQAATALNGLITGLFGLDRLPGGQLIVAAVPFVISIAVGWVLFMFLFQVLPQDPISFAHRSRGAMIGGIALTVMQYLTGLLFGLFGRNAAAGAFGPIIVLMLFLNVFARLVLWLAAWVATSEQPALGTEAPDEEPAQEELEPASAGRPAGLRSGDPVAARLAAIPVDGEVAWTPGAGQDHVPQEVAARSVRIGLGAGYVTGTATGIGVGAVIAFAVGAAVDLITGRRRRS